MEPDNNLVRIAILEIQIEELKQSINKQANEYERRLQELNHANQQQIERNASYVSRETWEISMDAHQKDDNQKHNEMNIWRREIDQWRWISIGASIAAGSIAGWITRLL